MKESFDGVVYTVQEGVQGRLDKVLTQLVEGEEKSLSRSQIKKRIESGAVSVNGIIASKAGLEVVEGDEIAVEELSEPSLLEPFQFEVPILYQDEVIAVIDKPPGIAVHPGAGTGNRTILNALLHMQLVSTQNFSGSVRPGIVHRLDKDTSGILLVAKTPVALTELSRQFQERTVQKEYLAIALRKPRGGTDLEVSDEGVIEAPIGRDKNNKLKMAIIDSGKPALTEWRIVERLNGAFVLKLAIHTGRTHQIRVHLESLKAPVLGDRTYGNFDSLPTELKGPIEKLGRQALHAETLQFKHPVSQKELSFYSPVPDDMSVLLKELRALTHE